MNGLTLTLRSMRSRRASVLLIILSLSLSIALYLSVLGVQRMTRASFENAMTGVDLLVAPRGNDMQILLYSFFNIGEPTGTITWSRISELREIDNVRAVIPLSLGDSVGKFRVMGTDPALFDVMTRSNGLPVFSFEDGVSFSEMSFENLQAAQDALSPGKVSGHNAKEKAHKHKHNDRDAHDAHEHGEHNHKEYGEHDHKEHGENDRNAPAFQVVLGATVAKEMDMGVGAPIVVGHGFGGVHDHNHGEMPFIVSGILAPTGTPFDSLVLVHYRAIDAIHIGYQNGRNMLDHGTVLSLLSERGPAPVSAAIVLAKNKFGLVELQRAIGDYEVEPLTAVLPGVALAKIWQLIGAAEKGFRLISLLVIIVALVALMAMTLTSLDGRRRELAILRSVGARPRQLVLMLMGESLMIATSACVLSLIITALASFMIVTNVMGSYGLTSHMSILVWGDLIFMVYIILLALMVTLWPAIQLYRRTIHDGITIRQ
jgi:putative ABC transport system permease protein